MLRQSLTRLWVVAVLFVASVDVAVPERLAQPATNCEVCGTRKGASNRRPSTTGLDAWRLGPMHMRSANVTVSRSTGWPSGPRIRACSRGARQAAALPAFSNWFRCVGSIGATSSRIAANAYCAERTGLRGLGDRRLVVLVAGRPTSRGVHGR